MPESLPVLHVGKQGTRAHFSYGKESPVGKGKRDMLLYGIKMIMFLYFT